MDLKIPQLWTDFLEIVFSHSVFLYDGSDECRRLILYKTNGQWAWSMHLVRDHLSRTLWCQFPACRAHCCLCCFFVNSWSRPYNSLNQPNLSWSQARRVISYRHALIGEVMRHTLFVPLLGNMALQMLFIYTKVILIFLEKISFSRLIPLFPKKNLMTIIFQSF